MSLPPGCAKADSGFVFMVRTRGELDTWTNDQLDERLRQVKSQMTADGAGLAFMRSYVRNIALAERRALISEIVKRIHTR